MPRSSAVVAAGLFASYTLAQAFNPMAIPPALSLDTFDLDVDEHQHQFYPGLTTQTQGASAEYLGPTLVLHRGDTARIRVNNHLEQVTSMHWHGMHVPGEMDGGPQRIIEPGASFLAEFEVKNPAATYWYHPHPHELTAEQANMGVAGFIIVHDEAEDQLDLPRTYGVDDFPIVIQDRRFQANGDFAFYPFGDSVLVNGTPRPYLECPAQVVRLRLLNGSNARVYALGRDDGELLQVIAGDGGLLPAPVVTDRLWLSNGERYDVLLDLTGMEGDSLQLVSYGSELPATVPGSNGVLMESSYLNGIDFPVLRIRVTPPTPQPVISVPSALVVHSAPTVAESIRSRTKAISGNGMAGMGMFMINGLMFDINVVNDTMLWNSVEVWTITNTSTMAHPMHVHGVSFWVLERNGQAPPAYEQGPKDVVLVDRFKTARIIMRFGELTNEWPFMYHCHNLMHEDNMMMLQYIVVDPTTAAAAMPEASTAVFPSPSTGPVRFRADHAVQRIRVSDMSGRMLFDLPHQANAEGTIDLSAMPRGLLLIELQGEGRTTRSRLVLEQP